jgi:hypothetical protein
VVASLPSEIARTWSKGYGRSLTGIEERFAAVINCQDACLAGIGRRVPWERFPFRAGISQDFPVLLKMLLILKLAKPLFEIASRLNVDTEWLTMRHDGFVTLVRVQFENDLMNSLLNIFLGGRWGWRHRKRVKHWGPFIFQLWEVAFGTTAWNHGLKNALLKLNKDRCDRTEKAS